MILSKKIFLFSSIALAIVLILWGIYNLSFRQIPEQLATLKSQDLSLSTTTRDAAVIEPLTDEAVLSPALSPDGQSIRYYSKTNGKAYVIDIASKDKWVISEKELIGLSDVIWSPDRSKVITEFSTATGRSKFFLYDYAQNKGTQLKDGLDTVIWQNNEKIFYKYFNAQTQERTLDFANPDGSNWQKITDLAVKALRIAPVPRTGLVSFWNQPDAFTETLMQSAPVLGGEKRDVSKGKYGADYLWSQDGNSLLISSVDTKGGSKLQLGVANSLGGEYRNLGIPTFISKCAWSKNNKTVYYALPGAIPAGTTLPNDYLAGGFRTNDTFWKIDIATGEKSRLVDLEKITDAYDAADLFLDPDEGLLFFTNRIDGKLYKITL
ncbi:MAG: hypothetical protein Q8L10_05400 [Candidatus Moranbacteria bacterium]|nr:hypothetical protein [Candidatus Moranbacteria bacterium]